MTDLDRAIIAAAAPDAIRALLSIAYDKAVAPELRGEAIDCLMRHRLLPPVPTTPH